jgi:AcrR family transcriptional regulator
METKEIITRVSARRKRRSEGAASRRERRAERRRAQILQAALRVFDSKGYERATTKEIAAEADVSEGILYYYFESKRDILIQLVNAYNESIIAELEELEAADIDGFVRETLRKWFSSIEVQRQFFNVVTHEVQLDHELWHEYHDTVLARVISSVEGQLREAVEEGLFRPLHTGIVTRAIIAMVRGLVVFKLDEDPVLADISTEEFADEIAALLLDGMRQRAER